MLIMIIILLVMKWKIYQCFIKCIKRLNLKICVVKYMKEENELDFTYGISDEELTERFKASIKLNQEICRIKGLPIACFDKKLKKPYLE